MRPPPKLCLALAALGAVCWASPALAQGLSPDDQLLICSRLRVHQGVAGHLERGLASEQRTQSVLVIREIDAAKGAQEVKGIVRPLPTGPASATTPPPAPLAYHGRPSDLAWLSAPALLGPLARDLRQGTPGERTVTLRVAGYPVALRVRLDPTAEPQGEPGRAFVLRGEGSTVIGETGVTLKVAVRARLFLGQAGTSRLDLRLRWTASGGPGADAEARVHLETRVQKSPDTAGSAQ